ncbi:fatty acid desaturase [Amycolatopsis sp. YIM 10]|uniref:fatty acid desaturase n=1 Tax=Amycolatopsis sp. YIM 10 TaxID=2653857 RepID=UPI0012AA1D0D|nr:fatty acid desaturase [Amycolatopsis sp. YIM 10]QFU92920.1 1,2-phenylacetyl-CoA epoxidase, subunit E [Amycolatopsis sp. YIM 10]
MGATGTVRELPAPGVSLPLVAVPTVALFAGGAAVWALGAWLALEGLAPLWVTVALQALATVTMFTVAHEAMHHAAGRLTMVNALLGRLAMPFVAAYGAFAPVRHLHLEHHRGPGGRTDVAGWTARAPAWQLPLRWLTVDFWFARHYLGRMHHRPAREVHETTAVATLAFGAMSTAIAGGYGWELLAVYLIPQRIGLALVVVLFDWFPHRGLPGCPGPDRLRVAWVHVGLERLAGPLTLGQNYHLVHHLHPAIPFYRYRRVWRRNVEAYLELGAPVRVLGGRELGADEYRASRWFPPRPAAEPPAEPPPRRLRVFHSLLVTEVERVGADAAAVRFAVPEELDGTFDYVAGQHVTVRALVDGVPLRRSYALCPAPRGELRIAVKRVERGPFSTVVTNTLRPGDRLDVLPPAGEFTLEPDPRRSRHYVGLAAGSGLPPILTMFATALDTEPHSRATLLYVNRSGSTTMLADELSALAKRFDGRLRVVHYRTDEQDPELRRGRDFQPVDTISEVLAVTHEQFVRGRLDTARLSALLDGRLHPAKVDEWYVCAPRTLAEHTLRMLAEHDVPAECVHHEPFDVDTEPAPAAELLGRRADPPIRLA